MRKKEVFSYFILAISIFFLLNVRLQFVEKMRGPFFGFEDLFAAKSHDEQLVEISTLKTENIQLKNQLSLVQNYLSSMDHIEDIYSKCESYSESTDEEFSTFYKKRLNQTLTHLNLVKWQVSANVIYRDPANWSSAIWVDVGSDQNTLLGKEVICENSPVVLGDQLIGVIEQVGKSKSKVRLITDAKLTPSVRCIRGFEQKRMLVNYCRKIKDVLAIDNSTAAQNLALAMTEYVKKYKEPSETKYLAKGYVQGSAAPIWRSRSLVLQGKGFNYDFGDEENAPISIHTEEGKNLFQPGDFLCTSGMDGVFPPNLLVGVVTHIRSLEEGAVACDLQAEIILPEYNNLQNVTILPPICKKM